jgi:hypothetical protein
MFLTLLGATRELREVRVEGLLSGLDLSEVVMSRCLFMNVGFVRCRFSARRAFENCVFEGSLVFQGCEGLAITSFLDCRLSAEAVVAIQQTIGAAGTFAVSEVQLRDGLREALRQMGAPTRFHPVDEATRRRGKLAASIIGEAVWDALIEGGVVEIREMGRGPNSKLFTIHKEAAGAVVQFMNSGLAVEGLGQALERLRAKYIP